MGIWGIISCGYYILDECCNSALLRRVRYETVLTLHHGAGDEELGHGAKHRVRHLGRLRDWLVLSGNRQCFLLLFLSKKQASLFCYKHSWGF